MNGPTKMTYVVITSPTAPSNLAKAASTVRPAAENFGHRRFQLNMHPNVILIDQTLLKYSKLMDHAKKMEKRWPDWPETPCDFRDKPCLLLSLGFVFFYLL